MPERKKHMRVSVEQIKWFCIATWLMGVLDLIVSLCLAGRFGVGIEANVVMKPLFRLPLLLVALKTAGIGGLLYLMWSLRALKIARFGVIICFTAYTILTLYHLCFLAYMTLVI